MKQSILEWSKNMVNVCAVDWGKLSLAAFNYFVVARRNTVRVSNYLIDVLLRFASFGVDLTKTSIAGHSMGAQISGRIGASLRIRNLTLGHIYGDQHFYLESIELTLHYKSMYCRFRSGRPMLYISMCCK